MKQLVAAAGVLAATVVPALAGGIERVAPSLDILFEPGTYVEFGVIHGNPKVRGTDVLGFGTGDVAGDFTSLSFAVKKQFTEQISGALILGQPFGADLQYPAFNPVAGTGSAMLGGTMVEVKSTHLTALLRYRHDSGVGVHGGLIVSRADGEVGLKGAAYGGVDGYKVKMSKETGIGWLAGVSYEIPEYAARVALTYAAPIEHEFEMTETLNGMPLGQAKADVDSPRSVTLDFQTGVAPDTLVFGQVRWVKWSEFQVNPPVFVGLTGGGLVELDNTTTYTLGVGRKFNDTWSGAASFSYESGDNALVSPLAPTDGRFGVTLAAIYRKDNLKITTGVNYTWLGDARPETGTPDVKRAQMKDNSAVTIGTRIGFAF